MRRRDAIGALSAALAGGCLGGAPRRAPALVPGGLPSSREGARARLDVLSSGYRALTRQHGLAEWEDATNGASPARGASALGEEARRAFDEARRILEYYGRGVVPPRQAELWLRGARALTLSSDARVLELTRELEHAAGPEAPEHARLALMERSSDASERRAAHALRHQLHLRAAPAARALLRRRRELAKEQRLGAYYPALLELHELDPRRFQAQSSELIARTRVPFARLMRQLSRALGRRVEPWDLELALERAAGLAEGALPAERAASSALSLARSLGFELSRAHARVVIERAARVSRAIGVSIPGDVRLALAPAAGAEALGGLVRAVGRAVLMSETRGDHPLYEGYPWVPGLSDEALASGVGELFAHALDDPEFARRQLALGARAASALMTARRAAALLATRSALTWAAFERTALENPDADLDRLSLLVARGVGGLPTPPPSEPIWAASPLLRGGPGVVESRVAGAMLGAALRDALRAKSRNAWISPSSGKWLVARFLADGVRWTLREKLVRALGGPLSVEPLVRYTSGG